MKNDNLFLVYLVISSIGISLLGLFMYVQENPITGMITGDAAIGRFENGILLTTILATAGVIFIVSSLLKR
jgi:hypothetical protein